MQDWITSAMGAAVRSGADLNAFASNLQPYGGDPIGSAMGAAVKAGADLSKFGSSLPGLPAAPTSSPGTSAGLGAPSGAQVGNVPDWLGQLISANAPTELANDPDFIRTVAAGAKAESGWDPNRVQNGFKMGSGAGARGLFQFDMGGMGSGIPEEQLLGDSGAQLQASRIVPLYAKAYASAPAGLTGAEKASWVAGQAERPYQFTDPNSAARRNYASAYNEIGGAVGGAVQGAKDLVSGAVDTARGAVRGAAQQISQFGDSQLSSDEAYAACGPAAAVRFASMYGRNPTLREAADIASSVGWTPGSGMAGLSSEKALMDKLNVPTRQIGADIQAMAKEAQTGNPVTISTPGHYFFADGYDPTSGAFHVGKSGTDLRGGSEWMTADQMQQRMGTIQGALLADNPQVPAPSTADSGTNPGNFLDRTRSAITSKWQDLTGNGNTTQPAPDFQVDLPQQDIYGRLTDAATGAIQQAPSRALSSLGVNTDTQDFATGALEEAERQRQAHINAPAGDTDTFQRNLEALRRGDFGAYAAGTLGQAAELAQRANPGGMMDADVSPLVSAGLGRAGVPGADDTGWKVQTPVGEIPLGPREVLGQLANLGLPSGEGGSLAEALASRLAGRGGRAGGEAVARDLSNVDFENLVRTVSPEEARRLVGPAYDPSGRTIPRDMPEGAMPGQTPLEGMGQELPTGGAPLPRSPLRVGGSEAGPAEAGQLPLGGMGQELPTGSAPLPKQNPLRIGVPEGEGMTGPDLLAQPDLKLPKYIPQGVQDLIQAAHTSVFDRSSSLDGPLQRLATAAGEDSSRVTKAWGENPDAVRALDEAMTQSQSRLGRLQDQLSYDKTNTQAVNEMVGELARYQSLQEAVGKRLPKAGSLLGDLTPETISGQGNLISQVKTMADNAKMTPEEWAAQLSKVDLSDPEKLASFAKISKNYTFGDKVTALWYFNLLSNPMTHIRNMVSNTATAVTTPVESLGAAAYDPLARRLLGESGPRQRYAGEAVAQLQGMKDALGDSGRAGLEALQYGTPGKGGEITRMTHEPFAGTPLEALGYPGRALEAEDQFFRGVNTGGALRGEAYRIAKQEGLGGKSFVDRVSQLTSAPTPEMLDNAAKQGEYRVFQQNDAFASKLNAAIEQWPALKFVVPFTRTPINVAKYTLERSPLAAGKIGLDFATPGGRRALREAGSGDLSDRLSRMTIGSTIMAGAVKYAMDDNLTGRAPDDPTERDAFYRQGKLPYAFKDPLTNNWHSYQALQPYSTLLGAAGDVGQAIRQGQIKDPADLGSIATVAAVAAGRGLANQTWTQGLADTLDLLGNSKGGNVEQKVERLATQYATNAIPGAALWRGLARMTDNVVRDPSNVVEGVEANLPGLSQNVPAREDAFGYPMERPQSGVDAFLNPFPSSHERDDPVENELARLQKGGYGTEPGIPGSSVTILNGKLPVDLTDEQQRRYQHDSGQLAYAALTMLVGTKAWDKMPDEAKQKEIDRIYSKTREVTRMQMTPELLGQGLEGFQRQQDRRDAVRTLSPTLDLTQEESDALAAAG